MSNIIQETLDSRAIPVPRPSASNYADDIRLVATDAELTAALKEMTAGKGGVIELAAGHTFSLRASDYLDRQEDAPVLIRSQDPSDPAILSQVSLTDRENIAIVDVEIYNTAAGLAPYTNLVTISNSDNIGIYDSEIHSNATGAAGLVDDPDADQTVGSSAMLVRGSNGVVLAGNKVYDANHGFALMESTGLTLVGNELTALQGDGIRLGGVQDLVIQANWLHDMYGSSQTFNHSDMIQFWGTNIQQNTVNVSIKDNVIDVGDGPSYQMIFGHNEHFESNGWLFEDIVIENNVLVGGTYHQISLNDTQNAVVRNNTVFTQEDGYSLLADGSREAHGTGWIKIGGENAMIENNIAAIIHGTGTNAVLTLGDGSKATDQTANFINLEAGASGDLRDLMLRADSPWNGVFGSDLLWTDGTNAKLLAVVDVAVSAYDKSVVRLDASATRDAAGYVAQDDARFEWTFADGSKAFGQTIEYDFRSAGVQTYSLRVTHANGSVDEIERTIEIAPAAMVDLAVIDGHLVNQTDANAALQGTIVTEGDAVVIGDGQVPNLAHSQDGVAGLNAFNFEMTIDAEEGSAGVFFYIHKAVHAEVTTKGAVSYTFTTDAGSFTATTKDGLFSEGARHLNFVYDGQDKSFSIYVDGAWVAETAATGKTLPLTSWAPTFGRPWGGTLDASLSNIRLSQEAADAGEVYAHYTALSSPAVPPVTEIDPVPVAPDIGPPVFVPAEEVQNPEPDDVAPASVPAEEAQNSKPDNAVPVIDVVTPDQEVIPPTPGKVEKPLLSDVLPVANSGPVLVPPASELTDLPSVREKPRTEPHTGDSVSKGSVSDAVVSIPIVASPPASQGSPSANILANNKAIGTAGNDKLIGGNGSDILVGGNGNDILAGQNGNDILSGGNGIDRMFGNDGNDRLDGGAFGDSLYGGQGIDKLFGSAGNDRVDGGTGNDFLYGGQGNDVVLGGQGDDRVDGFRGDDRLYGSFGNDNLYGGQGIDKLFGNAGNDRLDGGTGNDFLYGGQGHDVVMGGQGDDRVDGFRGNDRLYGSFGNDSLYGGDGSDRLEGNAGRDVLVGGAGKDVLLGGAGPDLFVFTLGDSGLGRANRDVVGDFQAGDDLHLLLIDADVRAAGNNAFGFSGTTAAANSVWYEDIGADVLVFGDVNGDGRADFSIEVRNIDSLSAGDFIF